MTKDYYLTLGIKVGATLAEIKSAYRRRALQLHPDTSGADSEAFIELQEAYRVLANPARARRRVHRPSGQEVPISRPSRVRARPRGEPLRAVQSARSFDEISLAESFAGFSPSFDDIFERLWGNFDLRDRPKPEGLESLTVDVPISPEEAAQGGEISVLIPARALCSTCGGQGAVGPYECWRCGGHGALTGQCPVRIAYPGGLTHDYIARVPLDQFGIRNFYLTLRFRRSDEFEQPG